MQIEKVRKIFYGVSFLSAVFAAFLSLQVEYRTIPIIISFADDYSPVSNALSTGLSGGAAGFAILSGLALI